MPPSNCRILRNILTLRRVFSNALMAQGAILLSWTNCTSLSGTVTYFLPRNSPIDKTANSIFAYMLTIKLLIIRTSFANFINVPLEPWTCGIPSPKRTENFHGRTRLQVASATHAALQKSPFKIITADRLSILLIHGLASEILLVHTFVERQPVSRMIEAISAGHLLRCRQRSEFCLLPCQPCLPLAAWRLQLPCLRLPLQRP